MPSRTHADVDRRCLRILLLVLAFAVPGLAVRGVDGPAVLALVAAVAIAAVLWLVGRLLDAADGASGGRGARVVSHH